MKILNFKFSKKRWGGGGGGGGGVGGANGNLTE